MEAWEVVRTQVEVTCTTINIILVSFTVLNWIGYKISDWLRARKKKKEDKE